MSISTVLCQGLQMSHHLNLNQDEIEQRKQNTILNKAEQTHQWMKDTQTSSDPGQLFHKLEHVHKPEEHPL